jgi:putative redox protein
MKIHVSRASDSPFHFVAKNDTGNEVHIDGSPDIGGQNLGARPMQMLLMSLAGCTGIDVVMILDKQRQEYDSFDMEVEGQRVEEAQAKPFSYITIHFSFTGSLEAGKAQRAIELSMEKYCSVGLTINKAAKIDYTLTVNGVRHV